jgi:hypothetical protein
MISYDLTTVHYCLIKKYDVRTYSNYDCVSEPPNVNS